MDSQVTELLTELTTRLAEVGDQVEDPERFFGVVHATAGEAEEAGNSIDAMELRSAFDREGFGRAGELLIRCVDDSGQSDLLAKLAEERIDDLVPEFRQLDADARAAANEEDSSAEEQAWQQAVQQFGPQWVDWDGSDEGWDQYRDWFYDATNAISPDVYALAYQNLDPLNADDQATRIAKLRDFGFDVSGAQVSASESGEALSDEEKAAELHQEFTSIVGELLPDEAAEYVTQERIDALIAEFPEAANLDQDQLRAVIQEAWDLANS